MKLKKTRKERTCHSCKQTILKGQQYGQRSQKITGKATQDEHREASQRGVFLIESFSVQRDFCACCAK
jgi:hypothetical protein